ncbi:multiple RNA-binding domain-containing protein 1, partial [Phenoliferia sp. Uapishka_3]
EGINLTAFSTPGPRSSTAILVKNIPYNTTSATLSSLFSPFGTISRLLLPPSGTMAIVEMIDAAAASAAWRGLVYKKLGASILYLEKAPAGLWTGGAPPPASSSSSTPSTSTLPSAIPSRTKPADDSEPGATLFIKNLSFATTSTSLTSAFSTLGGFVSARIQTKPDPKKPGATLSMGFGFVAFKTVGSATQARKARNGFMLEGHKLEVNFAHRGKEEEKKVEGKKMGGGSSTKLIVKNVPFEVTKKDLRELFSAYGQLNSVRLPRKLDNKTRGFAFLDFATRRDAESAFGALEHTHILGRHLVLQWADEGDDEVEKLRNKAKEFSKGGVGGRK